MAGTFTLAEAHEHLAEFAAHYEDFGGCSRTTSLTGRLGEKKPAFNDITHYAYWQAQTLYQRLTLESLDLY